MEIKRKNDILNTSMWRGQINFALEKFISQNRNAFVSMQKCAYHVDFQLQN